MAALLRDVLNDRLGNSTQAHLAFEVASLRAYVFATLDAIDHVKQHVERDEIRDKAQMLEALTHITTALENRIANLEDVRLELRRTDPHTRT